MSIKLYISQANQAHNAGPNGYTEKAGMDAISYSLAQLLKKDGRFTVRRNVAGNRVDTATENTNDANAWGAQYYVALHSNAGMKGTIVFYHSSRPKSRALAEEIYKQLRMISPGVESGGRVTAWDGLIEVHRPNCPAVLVEIEAHDWRTGVEFLTKQKREIALRLYRGICNGLNMKPREVTGEVIKVKVPLNKPAWWKKLKAWVRRTS